MQIDIDEVLKLLDRKDCQKAHSIIKQCKTTQEMLKVIDIQVTIDMLQAVLDENDVLQEYYGVGALEFLIQELGKELERNAECPVDGDAEYIKQHKLLHREIL